VTYLWGARNPSSQSIGRNRPNCDREDRRLTLHLRCAVQRQCPLVSPGRSAKLMSTRCGLTVSCSTVGCDACVNINSNFTSKLERNVEEFCTESPKRWPGHRTRARDTPSILSVEPVIVLTIPGLAGHARIMTTKTYIVAYPDPSLHSRDRVCPCEVGSKTFTKGILDQLCDQYPDHTQDLKRATLWGVSRCLSMTRYLRSITITGNRPQEGRF